MMTEAKQTGPEAKRIKVRIEQVFADIYRQRMAGLPVLNDALSVDTVGFDPYAGYYTGVLLTPWFMSLVLVPESPTDTELSAKIGDKRCFEFPAGQFEFILGHEDGIGHYWACSLFSPVFEFADQETAVLTARAAYEEIMQSGQPESPSEDEINMQKIWEGEIPVPVERSGAGQKSARSPDVSRRDMLRGRLGKTSDGREHTPTDGAIS